jgi:hypothetical protein
MNAAQAAELKAGDRVSWVSDPNACGTMTKTDSNWIVIQWDNGHTGYAGPTGSAMRRIVRAQG